MQVSAQRRRVPVRIVDWEATETRVRADLLEAAIRWGEFDELAIWSVTLPEEARALLREAGFNVSAAPASIGRAYRGRAHGSRLLVRPVRPEMPPAEWVVADRPLLDLEQWDLRMIYSDGF
ncbi:MAG: hypothetical protein H0V51_17080 [Chloroflexi bacterium]|nr:hypothetical protein [Chloroflexota bacterium]